MSEALYAPIIKYIIKKEGFDLVLLLETRLENTSCQTFVSKFSSIFHFCYIPSSGLSGEL